ncbi:MAG: hypothetical protein HQ526_03305 [Actinobacteria bacterium]|nr:hypothetical protein [Actinomycetota bacterium]
MKAWRSYAVGTNLEQPVWVPYLETEDISQALGYAAWRLEEIEIPLSA